MSQASSSGQSIGMLGSADYLGVLRTNETEQIRYRAVAPRRGADEVLLGKSARPANILCHAIAPIGNEEAGNEHLPIPGRLMIKQPCAPSRSIRSWRLG
jgi:hypothetical protein